MPKPTQGREVEKFEMSEHCQILLDAQQTAERRNSLYLV